MRLDFLKRPLVVGILAGLLGLVIGLAIGWKFWPVEWTDATPQALSAVHQEDYMRMAIDSYKVNPDPGLAYLRWQNLGPNAGVIFQKVKDNPGTQDMGAIMGFNAAVKAQLAAEGGGATNPGGNNGGGGTTPTPSTNNLLVIALGGILALAVIVGAAYFLARRLNLFGKQVAPEDYSPARQAQEMTRTTEKTDFSKMGLQDPITRTMTTYVLGDDLYDESFSIDSQAGEFLGEYGVGVSEAIGVGDPKKVTAIEIWLFDKNDIKTATKVLMSEHAFSDPNVRQRLEAKGELVQVEPHGQVILETATLQLLATFVDLEYGQGNMPPKSYFERITLELAIWPKG
jgi:hypothetical protein